jgi:delta-aminolevulinic acid dehydratase/porphobilinogen synthase
MFAPSWWSPFRERLVSSYHMMDTSREYATSAPSTMYSGSQMKCKLDFAELEGADFVVVFFKSLVIFTSAGQ